MASNKPTSNAPSLDPVNGESHVRKATVNDLGSEEHSAIYTRALEKVMSTGVSQSTFAQLVDGAPLSQTLFVMPGRPELTHPVYEHTDLCDGALEKVGKIMDTSNLHVLQFDFDLVRRYLAASPGSLAFKSGLIELMAVSVHQIAAYIYKLDLDVGSHKALLMIDNDAPTFFLHQQYAEIDQYPDGVADAVGYWAEAQIFGGVVLFDRRQRDGPSKTVSFFRTRAFTMIVPASSSQHTKKQQQGDDCFLPWNRGETVYRNLQLLDPEEWEDFEFFLSEYRALEQKPQDPYDIYFHSNHHDITYRIWKLLPEQRKALFEFLLSETGETKSPLPILPSEKNLFRVDPEDPITETRIYRDVWERKPLGDHDGDARRHHCRGDTVEYPCRTDEERSKNRGFFRNELIWEIKSLEHRAQEVATARARGAQSDSPPTEE